MYSIRVAVAERSTFSAIEGRGLQVLSTYLLLELEAGLEGA